jgi:prepilin-type N-terminal cleavage/methylation domain-containing protein
MISIVYYNHNQIKGASVMVQKNTRFKEKESGFTIVELLVVIVVIAILAAITIISYAGVTARANTSSGQSAANAFIQKAEAYNADQGSYPATTSLLTGATSDKVYALTGVAIDADGITAQPSTPGTVSYYKCGTTGIAVSYWNYNGTPAANYMQSGSVSGGSTTVAGTGCTVQA